MQGRAVQDEWTPVHGRAGGGVVRRPFVLVSGECVALTASARPCAAAGHGKRGSASLRGVREGEGDGRRARKRWGQREYHMGAPGGAGDLPRGGVPFRGGETSPSSGGLEHEA